MPWWGWLLGVAMKYGETVLYIQRYVDVQAADMGVTGIDAGYKAVHVGAVRHRRPGGECLGARGS